MTKPENTAAQEVVREQTIDIGNQVFCDLCGDDWTTRPESGGLLFGSKAVCPDCAPRMRVSAERYGELHVIKGECPDGVSFADWCLGLRDGNNTIRIIKLPRGASVADLLAARQETSNEAH